MASIDKRPNGKWRARYRVHPGGAQRSKHFDRKTDAERFLTRVRGQVLDGSYVDPSAGQVSFGEYAESWRQAQVHRRSTVVQVDAYLRNHMLPTFDDHPLASIRPSEVQAWVRGRSEVLAATTVETVFRIFSAILSDAVRDRRLGSVGPAPPGRRRGPRRPPRALAPWTRRADLHQHERRTSSAAIGSTRSGDPRPSAPATTHSASTTSATSTPRCSSTTASPSRSYRPASAMRRRPRHSTPTPTSGPTTRNEPAPPSTRSSASRGRQATEQLMPELCRFMGLVITMYHGDHPPPHFHVSYGRHNAQVLLDGRILAGVLPRRQQRLVRR